MKRKKLVMLEMLFYILIVIGIIFLVFNIYFIFKGFGIDVLHVNDKNRQSIKNIIEKSKYYDSSKSFDDVKKIQFFLAFDDFEFTIYYNDGTTKTIYDDDLTDLEKYIEKNGYNKGKVYLLIGIGVIISCVMIKEAQKKISDQIDLIDKIEE